MTALTKLIRGRTAVALATAGAVVVAGGVPVATGAITNPLTGGKRNPSSNQSSEYTSETQIIATTSTYGTRQSNKSESGGGAIYGCRARPTGKPCIRANNLSDGRAFEFQSDNGTLVGTITTSKGGDGAKPFTTNATGVADGLNADRVDGKNASDFIPATDAPKFAQAGDLLFATVAVDGAIGNGRGNQGNATLDAPANTFTVTFDRDVSKCSYTATQSGVAATPVTFVVGSGGTTKVTIAESGAIPVPFHLQVIC